MTKATQERIPVHQWTHTGERVLLLKCVNEDGSSHKGFKWPESGPVKPETCSRDASCDSGGLFGWPWGIGHGQGKEPNYKGKWIVFSAPPTQVIEVAGKSKVAADSPSEVDCVVEFCGSWWAAMHFIAVGRDAWIEHYSSGAASNSGYSGAASNSGYSGAASNSGDRGAASNSGYSGAASNSGDSGAALTTGEYSTIELGPRSAGVSTASRFTWIEHTGAVLLVHWIEGDEVKHRTLVGQEDAVRRIQDGRFVREFS